MRSKHCHSRVPRLIKTPTVACSGASASATAQASLAAQVAKEQADAEARQAAKKRKKNVEIEVLDDDAEDDSGEKKGAEEGSAGQGEKGAAAGEVEEVGDNDDDDDDDDDAPKPEGNGGKTDRYVWTQTLQDVTVTFPVRAGLKSRHLNVVMKSDRLKLEIKNEDVLCDGELCQRIKTADSTWTIEDSDEGRRIVFCTFETFFCLGLWPLHSRLPVLCAHFLSLTE